MQHTKLSIALSPAHAHCCIVYTIQQSNFQDASHPSVVLQPCLDGDRSPVLGCSLPALRKSMRVAVTNGEREIATWKTCSLMSTMCIVLFI